MKFLEELKSSRGTELNTKADIVAMTTLAMVHDLHLATLNSLTLTRSVGTIPFPREGIAPWSEMVTLNELGDGLRMHLRVQLQMRQERKDIVCHLVDATTAEADAKDEVPPIPQTER